MDSTPIPTTESSNPSQQPPNSQPTNEELAVNQATQELATTIPIDVPEANARSTGENATSEIAGRESQETSNPNRPNTEIIDLDDEESRKCEEPKEMHMDREKCNNEEPCLQVCEQSQPLVHNVPNGEENQEAKITNVENSLQEIGQKNEKEQPAVEKEKEQPMNEEIIQQIHIEKEDSNIMIEEEVIIRKEVEIPKEIEIENKQTISNQNNIDLEGTNNLDSIAPIQQNQVELTQIILNESLPLVEVNENDSKAGTLNSPNEPMIDENKECDKINDHHEIQIENNSIPQIPNSTNDKNSPTENLNESIVAQESMPNEEKRNQENSNLSGSLPILIEDCQAIEVTQKENLEGELNEKDKNDKIVEVNILNAPDTTKSMDVELVVSEPQKIDQKNEKVQNEVVEKSETEKPKEGNEASANLEKIIEGNGKKNVKEIKELLLASLSGDFAETLALMSDEEILKIFEEIQAEEDKKEDEKKQTDEGLKTKESKPSPQQTNKTAENPKKSKGKEEIKEVPKPNTLAKPNTRQTQNSPKTEKQEFELSNNQKSIQSKKDVGNGSSKVFSKSIGESDKFEECKEGTPEVFQKKNPEIKSGNKKKIVTTIIQQVEYFEDEDKEGEALSKYRKNENGESKRVGKKEKMNSILSQISSLVHELNFQEVEEEKQ